MYPPHLSHHQLARDWTLLWVSPPPIFPQKGLRPKATFSKICRKPITILPTSLPFHPACLHTHPTHLLSQALKYSGFTEVYRVLFLQQGGEGVRSGWKGD